MLFVKMRHLFINCFILFSGLSVCSLAQAEILIDHYTNSYTSITSSYHPSPSIYLAQRKTYTTSGFEFGKPYTIYKPNDKCLITVKFDGIEKIRWRCTVYMPTKIDGLTSYTYGKTINNQVMFLIPNGSSGPEDDRAFALILNGEKIILDARVSCFGKRPERNEGFRNSRCRGKSKDADITVEVEATVSMEE